MNQIEQQVWKITPGLQLLLQFGERRCHLKIGIKKLVMSVGKTYQNRGLLQTGFYVLDVNQFKRND